MVKKREINSLQRERSRRNRTGRTSGKDKMKKPSGRNNGIRKRRKTNRRRTKRRRTKRRRTKRSMNEGKGEAGARWLERWKRPKTHVYEVSSDGDAAEGERSSIAPAEVQQQQQKQQEGEEPVAEPAAKPAATIDGEVVDNKGIIFESILHMSDEARLRRLGKMILPWYKKMPEWEQVRELILNSCYNRERDRIEYQAMFGALRTMFLKYGVLGNEGELEQTNIPPFLKDIREFFDSISQREGFFGEKNLSYQQIIKIKEIFEEESDQNDDGEIHDALNVPEEGDPKD